MAFYGAPLGDTVSRLSASDRIVSTRTLLMGKETITCWEYVPGWLRGHQDNDVQSIRCSTPRGDFFSWFDGDKASVPDFYRVLQLTKPTNLKTYPKD
jgi:hypothetical protein